MLTERVTAKKFGLYVHIPYCLQRCSYCDFTTFEKSQIAPPETYMEILTKELHQRRPAIPHQGISTLYFGGGTPSLIEPELIGEFIRQARELFVFQPNIEITIEINPATISPKSMDIYMKSGINRFSVGIQTFDESLLKSVGRIHSANDSRSTLKLLKDYQVNFSLDLLFALPRQTIDILNRDLDEILTFEPPHISPYCLTVKEGHPLEQNRPSEVSQLEMFDAIAGHLADGGYRRYEISNFARPGFESRHNNLYWTDDDFWGLGVSAHSYLSLVGPWGTRFWNSSSLPRYFEEIGLNLRLTDPENWHRRDSANFEVLQKHESVTDFLHTSLRRHDGLQEDAFSNKFGNVSLAAVRASLRTLADEGLVSFESSNSGAPSTAWRLSNEGLKVSNLVFRKLTYTKGDL